MPRVPSLTLLLLAGGLAAADSRDLDVADLRFNLGTIPAPNHAEGYYTQVQTPSPGNGIYVGAPRDEIYGSSIGIAGSATATWGHLSPLGLLYGGGFRYAGADLPWEARRYPAATGYPTTGGVLDKRAIEAQGLSVPGTSWTESSLVGEIGVGWAFADRWHAELMGTASLDWVTLDYLAYSQANASVGAQQGKGIGYTLGGRLGFYWTSEARWQLGFGGGWSKSHASIDTSFADNTVHADLVAIGFSGYGSVGYRF